MDLVAAFYDTWDKSTQKYSSYTNGLKNNTKVYTEEELLSLKCEPLSVSVKSVISDTVSYILNSNGTQKRAALNFADGYVKGGLILQGATTQEECLCRSSNLYESLSLEVCEKEYYSYNQDNPSYNRGNCSDRLIYTEDVLFFKDSKLHDIENITEQNICDIITCPAPICNTTTDMVIMQRMENIIKVAAEHKVKELILGAWGCGAFGNDLGKFLTLWESVISCNKYVPFITFAFLTEPPRRIEL